MKTAYKVFPNSSVANVPHLSQDRVTLAAPRQAIVWQDRRTAEICTKLREAGHEDRVSELTGLRLDPYFTATKITWLAEHEPATWQGLADGFLAAGTVDSYLIARLTGGHRYVTDPSNASGRCSSTSAPAAGPPNCARAFPGRPGSSTSGPRNSTRCGCARLRTSSSCTSTSDLRLPARWEARGT